MAGGLDEPLKVIEPLIQRNRATLIEGDVLSVLKGSEFIARSFEFSLADCGLDCTSSFPQEYSFADRFWDLDTRAAVPGEASDIALIDIKSEFQTGTGYYTTLEQRRRVAIYICVGTSNRAWVNVIPNFFQDRGALNSDERLPDDRQRCWVTFSRQSRLPPTAYGSVDQACAPYRMPFWMLPEAVKRLRAHIRGECVYRNPWTDVSFEKWRPRTVRHTLWMKPSEAPHRSGYEAVMRIYQALRYGNPAVGPKIRADFVGLQPLLADFKLVLDSKQVLVQMKAEGRRRGAASTLDDVAVAREQGGRRVFFYCASDRFDYLLQLVEFSQHRGNPQSRWDCFFLPEKVLPDSFYTTLNKDLSFEIPEFQEYRFQLDDDGDWIKHMVQIVQANPSPRKGGERPYRDPVLITKVSVKPDDEIPPLVADPHSLRGRGAYRAAMDNVLRTFFYKTMAQCAHRRSGLLFALGRNHPDCELGYIDYAWSVEEAHLFLDSYHPPRYLQDLPPDVEAVPICCFARHRECSSQGPNVTGPQFRRLDASDQDRLVVWDLGGPDTPDVPTLTIIPSEDIQPSPAQRSVLLSNLGAQSNATRKTTPILSAMLATGLQAAEYKVGTEGPQAFSSSGWAQVWSLLHGFVTSDQVEHPVGMKRRTTKYRKTIRDLNQRQLQEHLLYRQPEDCAVDDDDD